METLLTIAVGIVAIALVIKFIGSLLRIIIGVVVILVAVYLVYQFVLT